MAATRCIKCTKVLDGGGQYCDDCARTVEPVVPRGASSTVVSAPACPTCGRTYESGTRFCASCDHHTRTEVEYGGFLPRLGAYVIDAVILGLFGVLVAAATSPQNGFFVNIAASLVYHVGFWVTEGATPGKKVFGLRVVSVDGSPIEIWQGVLRVFGYWLDGITFGIGFLMILFSAEERGLHDFVANTVVIRERRQLVAPPAS
jgi:uncharacterized RDD family membrane protein YckC